MDIRTVCLSLCILNFLVSTDAYSQPVFLEEGGQVVVEAETFSSRTSSDTHEWLIVPGEVAGYPSEFTAYRGDGYVQARPEGFGGSTPLNPPYIDYTVRINTTGTYRLYVRWVGPNNDADTFYASIAELSDGSGGAIADWYRFIRISQSFSFAAYPTWFGYGGFERTNSPYSNGETPVVWNITTAGDYTVRFSMREDGAAIDAFVFQLSSLSAPTGDGPPPSEVAIPFEVTTRFPPFVLGESISLQLATKGGVEPITWSVIDGALPVGMGLRTDGVFHGTPTELGGSTFTVQVSDSDGGISERTYTVEVVLVMPPPDISIRKVGATPVPGREIDYFAVIENVGEVSATDLLVSEFLEPWYEYLSSNTTPSSINREPDPFPTPINDQSVDYDSVINWTIPELAPGEVKILSYKARLDPAFPIGETVRGEICFHKDILDRCYSDFGLCSIEGATACAPLFYSSGLPLYLACTGTSRAMCVASFNICAWGVARGECYTHEEPANRPVDPNEKLVVGNFKRLEDGTIVSYIQPDQTLVYPIHFENIGTVEALDVFVTDVLDPNLDESTLDIITPDGASYDPTTRALRWELLNRNLQPGETGNVLLSIKPVSGLSSGTEIRNDAEIQFEIFDPLVTPEVVNIIDTTKPSCIMNALPVVSLSEEFTLSWTGTDDIGEIKAYAVFVSTNGTGWKAFISETTETSAQFTGQNGSTYEFLCAAKDTAGNTEDESLVSEATTTVKVEANVQPVSDPNGPYTGTAGVVITLDGSGSSDSDGMIVFYNWDFGDGTTGTGIAPSHAYAAIGTYTVSLTVTDDGGATATATTTVEIVNQTPVAICNDITLIADSTTCNAISASIDNGSFDPDGDPITLTQLPSGPYELGETAITLTVIDDSGASDTCTGILTVTDTTPPTIDFTLTPDILWPPNHKMVSIKPTIITTDACDADPIITLNSISMNEGDETNTYDSIIGDSNTVNDIEVDQDGNISLRAERSGIGNGRIYTVTYKTTDASGNSAIGSATVTVPHNK